MSGLGCNVNKMKNTQTARNKPTRNLYVTLPVSNRYETTTHTKTKSLFAKRPHNLMLSGRGFASKLCYGLLGYITHTDHADSLPNTEADSRSDTTVQTLHAIVLIDVFGRFGNGQILRTVRIPFLLCISTRITSIG